MFASMSAAFRSSTFIGQLILTMLINCVVNGGYAWATFSAWGGKPSPSSWPRLSAWTLDPGGVNSCLALDMLLSTFLMGFLTCLLGTGGTQKEVREKKCDTLPPELLSRGWWRFTPVPLRSLCLRAFAIGAFITAVIGVPSFLIMWCVVQGGSLAGLSWVIFKTVWATLVAGCVYVLVFPSAISKANFPELEFEELQALAASSPRYAYEQELPHSTVPRPYAQPTQHGSPASPLGGNSNAPVLMSM